MMRHRYIILVLIVAIEIGIYFYSNFVTSDLNIFYSLGARYSARVSFIISGILGLWLAYKGVFNIFKNVQSRNWLLGGIAGVALNHLIHFFFLFKNFEINNLDITSKIISFGAIGYVIITLIPIYLWNKEKINKSVFVCLYGFVMLMIGISVYTYSTRFSSDLPLSPPASYFQISIVVGSLILVGLIWRVITDLRNNPI